MAQAKDTNKDKNKVAVGPSGFPVMHEMFVPKAIFFMEDPGLRDKETHEVNVSVPAAVYGRELVQEPTTIEESAAANAAMWAECERSESFGITSYLATNGKELFCPSLARLRTTVVRHAENKELRERLLAAIGD